MRLTSKLSKKKGFMALVALFFFSFFVWITAYYFMFIVETRTFIACRIPAQTMEFERMKMERDLRELDVLFEGGLSQAGETASL